MRGIVLTIRPRRSAMEWGDRALAIAPDPSVLYNLSCDMDPLLDHPRFRAVLERLE